MSTKVFLLTFISNIDNLPGARFILRNDNQTGLIVQNTVVVNCFSPECYSIPVSNVLSDLYNGPWFDCKAMIRFFVACCYCNILCSIVCKA